MTVPPALGDGPFVAAGWWPLLSTSSVSPTYFNQNYSVLWTFSDDFAACEEDCTHSAEYQIVGAADLDNLGGFKRCGAGVCLG